MRSPNAIAFVFLPALLWAQLQVSLIQGTTEVPLREVVDLGSVDASDQLEARFRVRNQGAVTTVVHTLQVAGAGFARKDVPALPVTLAPGAAFDFSIRVSPSGPGAYSAVLTVNTISVLLRARATAGPVLQVEDASGRRRLASGDAVDFGRIEAGLGASRRFFIENPYASSVEVAELAVQGAAFRLSSGFAVPRSLEAGGSLAFQVLFEPASVGAHSGRLVMNGRVFSLFGTATEAPLPRPQILLDPGSARSGQQMRVRVRLAEKARSAGQGELRIRFEPAQAGWPDDPAIGFVSPGGRSVRFAIEAGTDAARFDGRDEIVLQTGTTAGRLTLEAQLGPHVEQATVTLAPLPVVVDTVRVERRTAGLEVYLAGFDNMRSVSQIAFAFYGTGGQLLEPGAITVDATAEFRRYFESAGLGGLFALRAAFPVTGDVSRVAAVEIEIRNSAGSARTSRVTF
ncbi:MAG: choice-of-anchor D domain-containing protein [Bryobacterales bacterium]|nr:choice-of-anchor D domain-containing protein [Bryobacterales bacterium]